MASSAAFSVAGVAFEAVSSGASHFFKFLSTLGESLAGFNDTAVNAFKGLGGLSAPFENFFEKAFEEVLFCLFTDVLFSDRAVLTAIILTANICGVH